MGFAANLTGLLIAAALPSACQTTGDAPAEAEPALAANAETQFPESRSQETRSSGVRAAGGPIAGSATSGTLSAKRSPAATPAPPIPTPAAQVPALPTPAALPPAQTAAVPHIYMALQSDGAGSPVSAVFAIDAARDNTPSNDPAVRLAPENGRCNAQEMRSYTFPPQDAAQPVVSEARQSRGLTAANLPGFMAASVTDMMRARGLASDREQTSALNICTRKLWEQLVLSQTGDALAAGQ